MQKANGFFKPLLGELANGGILLEVTSKEEARIGEDAGVKAVLVPFQYTAFPPNAVPQASEKNKRLNSLSNNYLQHVLEIKSAVSIPVIAQCRRGHFVEAQILEALRIDFIEENEVLPKVDDVYSINKRKFRVPFLCGAHDLGSALRHVHEGAALLRTAYTKHENPLQETVAILRKIRASIEQAAHMHEDELDNFARNLEAPYGLLQKVSEQKKLPVPLIAQGGIVELCDCALMMQLGASAVIVDSKIWHHSNARESIQKLTLGMQHYRDPEQLLKISLSGHQQMDKLDQSGQLNPLDPRLVEKKNLQNVDYSMPFLTELKKTAATAENLIEYEIT